MDKQDEILKTLLDVVNRLERIEKIIHPKQIIKNDLSDPLLSEVIEYIKEKDIINLADLQMHFKIGYARAARIKDELISSGYAEDVTDEHFIRFNSGIDDYAQGIDTPDILFNQAVEIISQFDKASASLLQRRLKIGYARAARLLDELEAKGYVAPAEGSKPREVIKRQTGKKTILFVEDEPMIREVFGNLLRDSGYSIDYAEDGVIGLDKIKKNNYDLIILGIMMPNMTGIDVLEHLSEEKIPHGKIIIFTNLNTPEIKQQTYSLGASDFWVKAQMTPVMLLEKIKNLTL